MSALSVNIVYMRRSTGNNHPKNPNPVVSVRIERAALDVLDELVDRTGRSRGFYLREAIHEYLPTIVSRYWADAVRDRQDTEDQRFAGLIAELLPPDTPSES